jgi:Na+/H+ antiporter NhaA
VKPLHPDLVCTSWNGSAILDDLGALLIIAVFYTGGLNLFVLGGAAFVLVLLMGLNRAGFTDLKPYLLLGVVLWFLGFLSGIHATLAGGGPGAHDPFCGSPPASRRT